MSRAPLRVTVITPSYQQRRFLEATLRSVAAQDYPEIEHIVIDGGSRDGSVELLDGWSEHPIAWVSEPDRGQAHAIEKGIARATGNIIAWLNSDDIYLGPRVISEVVAEFEAGAQIVAGGGRYLDADGSPIADIRVRQEHVTHRAIVAVDFLLQPATFVAREIHLSCPLDLELHYAFDWDFFIRATAVAEPVVIDRPLAGYRLHGVGKTQTGGQRRRRELAVVARRYQGRSIRYLMLLTMSTLHDQVDRLPGWPARVGYRLIRLAQSALRRVDGLGVPS